MTRHLSVIVLFITCMCQADDTTAWPIFRGTPQLQGASKVVVSDTPKRLWTFRTHKAIKSAAVASKTHAFCSSTDGNLYAIDLTTGKSSWTFNTKAPIKAPPLVVGEFVYVGNDDGIFQCLSAATGTLIWSHKTDATIVGSANTISINKKDVVIYGSHDSFIYARDAVSGTKIWSYEADNFINGAPAIIGTTHIAFGCCDGNLYLLRQSNGKRTALIQTGSYIAGSAAIEGTNAWVGNYGSQFMNIDLTNKSIRWTFGEKGNGTPFFSSPAIEKDRVVVGGRDGKVYCFLKESGKKLWAFQTKDEVNSSPLIVSKRIIVGSDDGRLYMLKLINGTKVWEFETGASISASPIIVGHTLLIGAHDGRLYAFDCKTKE